MSGQRFLVVTADDFGIGPAVSRGILDLARQGRVTGTVLLVNSPFAADAVRSWRQAGMPLDLGWHPCLTLDAPLLPAGRVPSLVGDDGQFLPLKRFLRRASLGRIRASEVHAELQAQLVRFHDLVGRPPVVVNSHHHCQLFGPVGAVLLELLAPYRPRPFLRRMREPWQALIRVPGARLKRTVLSLRGRRHARRADQGGFPGNEWLAGITDPPWVADPAFLVRWLTRVPGRIVELSCHPGHEDTTLLGRDCTLEDGMMQRRMRELELLQHESFSDACRQAGFTLVAPSQLGRARSESQGYAA